MSPLRWPPAAVLFPYGMKKLRSKAVPWHARAVAWWLLVYLPWNEWIGATLPFQSQPSTMSFGTPTGAVPPVPGGGNPSPSPNPHPPNAAYAAHYAAGGAARVQHSPRGKKDCRYFCCHGRKMLNSVSAENTKSNNRCPFGTLNVKPQLAAR